MCLVEKFVCSVEVIVISINILQQNNSNKFSYTPHCFETIDFQRNYKWAVALTYFNATDHSTENIFLFLKVAFLTRH